jgi:hypothetical protein
MPYDILDDNSEYALPTTTTDNDHLNHLLLLENLY